MTSFRSENAARQTEFRLAALENGYTPVPNNDKRTFFEGWNTVQPTPLMILLWRSALSYQATGLRVENGLCAIDVDIDDADIVSEIWDRAVAEFPQLGEALVRYGSGHKEMWVCRVDEEFSVLFSTTHTRAGDDPDGEDVPTQRLEAFGGGHARQIGSCGAHTMNSTNDGFAVEYQWVDDESPETVRLDSLPLLAKDNVLRIAHIASEVLEENEWPRLTRSRAGESDCSTTYDLTDEMVFKCVDGVSRSLGELAEYAKTSGNARCSASWTGDEAALNRTRCLVSTDHTGVPTVLETANWSRHMPATAADAVKPISERAADLRDKMKDAGYDFDEEGYDDAPASFREIVSHLIDHWAWCGSRTNQCLPIHGREDAAMSLSNLRLTYIIHAYEREGPKGGIIKVNPVDAWLASPRREDVDGYRFMPDNPQGIFTTLGVRAINSYRAPQFVDVRDRVARASHAALWSDFLTHLLPVTAEREWFFDWLAHKFQNPTVPSVGVIMVAKRFGVGRGTLFDIVEPLFGRDHVNNIGGRNLIGADSQGQYTEWLANALLVTTDEMLPDGDDGMATAWRRKQAYERLKERVDPRARQMQIVRKTLPNYQDMVYASFIMATQHENALPIPEGDRRFTVLTNNRTTLQQNVPLMKRINAMRSKDIDPAFVSVLADTLAQRDVSAFNAHLPPEFKGKRLMTDANVGEIEGIVEEVLDGMPYDWCTLDSALDRVERILIRRNIKDNMPKWRSSASDQIKLAWDHNGRGYVAEDRRRKAQIMLRDADASHVFDDLTLAERAEQHAEMSNADSGPTAKMRALRQGLSEV